MIYNVSFSLRGKRTLGRFVRLVIVRGPGGTKGPSPVEAIVETADGREHTVRRNSIETYHDPRTVREYQGRLHRTTDSEREALAAKLKTGKRPAKK